MKRILTLIVILSAMLCQAQVQPDTVLKKSDPRTGTGTVDVTPLYDYVNQQIKNTKDSLSAVMSLKIKAANDSVLIAINANVESIVYSPLRTSTTVQTFTIDTLPAVPLNSAVKYNVNVITRTTSATNVQIAFWCFDLHLANINGTVSIIGNTLTNSLKPVGLNSATTSFVILTNGRCVIRANGIGTGMEWKSAYYKSN